MQSSAEIYYTHLQGHIKSTPIFFIRKERLIMIQKSAAIEKVQIPIHLKTVRTIFLLNQSGETNRNWKQLQSTINNHLPQNQPLQNVIPPQNQFPQIQSQVEQYQYPQFQYQIPITTYPGQGQYDMNAAIYTQNPQNQYSFNQVQAQVQNEQNQYPQAQHHLQETMYPPQVQDQVHNEQNQYPTAQNHLIETTYPPQDQYLMNPQTHSQNLHYQKIGCPYPDQHSRTHHNTLV